MPAAVVVAVVPAVALWQVADSSAATADRGAPPTTAAASAPTARVATPLLSARRLPGVVTGKLATTGLLTGLAGLGKSLSSSSCLTVAVDGATVFDDGGATSVMPASNMKVVTAAVALDRLGADSRYTTTVKAPGVTAGRVDGDLYLVGGGDPVLGTQAYIDAATADAQRKGLELPPTLRTSLEDLADSVVNAGVKQVSGAVVGDDSRYDAERYVPSWPASYASELEAGPLGALMVNDAMATFSPFTEASDPAVHAAGVFTQLLRDRGVTVAEDAERGTAPATATDVASIQSAPLRDVVAETLTASDDNSAELLLKEIGHQAGGQGTRAAGSAAVMATLAAWGIPTEGVALVDGSGLDRGNRLTCNLLLGVINHAGASSDLVAGFPVAGKSGTLTQSFGGSALVGRLRAKTGTLTGAKALSGVVPTEGGHVISFSFVYNGPDERRLGPQLWDRLGKALEAYPSTPDLTAFSPLPASS